MFDSVLFPTPGQPVDPAHTVSWIRAIFGRVELNLEEQMLWLWLMAHSVLSESHSCTCTYQELADVMSVKPDKIHRDLLRLRLHGFVLCQIPLLHGIVSPESAKQKRELTPTLPEIEERKRRDANFSLAPKPKTKGEQNHDTICYQ
jgi:hypothetical protein